MGVFAGNFFWFGWVSCSLFPIQNQSQPTKSNLPWEKSGPNATFNLFFVGFGWPWVGGFVGFIMIFTSYMFSNPTYFGKLQAPYSEALV